MNSKTNSATASAGDATSIAAAAQGRWPADDWRGPLLVVRLSSLGDVILTSGPLRLLAARRPDLTIRFLTRALFAPMIRGLPFVTEVLSAESAAPPLPANTVCDWQGGSRGRAACRRFTREACYVGYPSAALHRRLLILGGTRIPAPESFVVRLARSIAGGAIPADALVPQVRLEDEALVGEITRRLRGCGRPERGWLVLGPSASRRLKAVPERLAAGIEERFGREGWGIVRLRLPGATVGDPQTTPGFELFEEAPGRLEFRGGLTYLAALLRCATLFVGSDSGVLHLATALRIPAVGLFGPTSPILGFSPLGNAVAVGVDLACRPCHVHGPRRCWLGHRRCWRELSPDLVLRAATGLEPRNTATERSR